MSNTPWNLHVIGGANGIGQRNCLWLSHPKSLYEIMIDCGGTQEYEMELKVDESWRNDEMLCLLVEKYKQVLKKKKQLIVLLTHFHYDHVGRVPFFLHYCDVLGLKLPEVVSHDFTLECVRNSIESMYFFAHENPFDETSRDQRILDQQHRVMAFPCGNIDSKQVFDVNEYIVISAIEAVHSVYASHGYCLVLKKTPNDEHPFKFIYTGDYKWLEVKSSPECCGADLVLTDATSITREDFVSEETAVANILTVYQRRTWKGPTFMSLFSTNVERLYAVIRGLNAIGVTPFVHSKAIQSTFDAFLKVSRLQRPRFVTQVSPRDFSDLNAHTVVISTGVWGQGFVPYSALARMTQSEIAQTKQKRSGLAKLAAGDAILRSEGFWGIKAFPGSGVILSGSLYPFIRKSVEPMIVAFKEMGVEVVVDNSHTPSWNVFRDYQILCAPIHSSGHAQRGAFERVMRDLAPRKVAAFHCDPQGRRACHAFAHKQGVATLDLEDGCTYDLIKE